MNYLVQYRTHKSIEELNASVKGHILNTNLVGNARKVLECLAKHSLKFIGACHIKADTIASELGISRSTVTRCIKKLKDLHVINVHNNSKLNGIKGANIYAIIFFKHTELSNEPTETSHRKFLRNTVTLGTQSANFESESLSCNLFSNSFLGSVSNNVTMFDTAVNLKEALKDIYQPNSAVASEAFEELCKIAFGRLKKFMRTHNMPYLQMGEIIVRCMKQLVVKQNVRNQFAMFSKMIERQVLQLFEQPIRPEQVLNKREKLPDWFETRNEHKVEEVVEDIDFEIERKRLLAKLGYQ